MELEKPSRCLFCDQCWSCIFLRVLMGKVRIGCQNTPAFKSHYCPLHLPMTGKPLGENESSNSRSSSEDQITPIVGKRTTRISTLYHVHVCTWYTLYDIWTPTVATVKFAQHTLTESIPNDHPSPPHFIYHYCTSYKNLALPNYSASFTE